MNCIVLELVYSKDYFNLVKILVLRLFKMAENPKECSRLEQKSVIKFFVAEKCKPWEIYGRMFTNGLGRDWRYNTIYIHI